LQSIRNFFSRKIFTRYVWFYLAIALTAVIAFWSGIQYGKTTQPAGDALKKLFETDVPEWVGSVETSGSNKSIGNPDAGVTVVEYMDIECPFCQRYAARIFPRILENYIKPGKIHYIVKHFPLSKRIHPHATMGAIAAECAANQSKFWEYKTLAMANRRYQSKTLFMALANIVDMPDQQQFNRCFNQQQTLNTVRHEKNQGVEAGVKGTPSVIVNGTVIRGIQPYSKYRSTIETALESN
jgi:protein-disulfide isomerase